MTPGKRPSTPGLRFDVTCPRCGSAVALVTTGGAAPRRTVALMRCVNVSHCGREWFVAVTMADYTEARRGENELDGRGLDCGTPAGARQHRDRGEPLCDRCDFAQRMDRVDRNRQHRERRKVNR